MRLFRPPARYALMRLPENLASFIMSRALMALVISTTNREHAKVYEQAETLHGLVAQPDFFDKDLASIVQPLLAVFLGIYSWRLLLTCSLTSQKIPSASGPLIYCQKHIHHCHCRSHLPIWGCLGRKLLPVTGHASFYIWHFSIIPSGWEKCMDVWSFHTDPIAKNEIECAWSDWAIFQWVWYLVLVPDYSSGPRFLLLPFSCR